MDHIPAGVGVISIPIWNPLAFQSIVLEIQCPALPAPIVAKGGLATPTAMRWYSSGFQEGSRSAEGLLSPAVYGVGSEPWRLVVRMLAVYRHTPHLVRSIW